jgi:uncharacterized protein YukE
MKIKLTNREIIEYLGSSSPEFPKYTTQLINLANKNAQGTRPRVVGKVTELIQEFPGKSLAEWEKWYLKRHPEAINTATNKIVEMLEHLKKAMNRIDRILVEQWVRDLVILKTFVGLRFQEAILKKVAENQKSEYRLASPEEESQGIDGFIRNKPISIKPATYKFKKELIEDIQANIIYYSKRKDGIIVEFEEI